MFILSVISDHVQGPVWEGYPESLDEKVFIYLLFNVKLNIVFDQKIVILNTFKCHIKKITNTRNVPVKIT